jgi:hypothetical protein
MTKPTPPASGSISDFVKEQMAQTNKETTPKETAPKETAPKETAPKETSPKETAPKETTPKETSPKETAPKETTPKETDDLGELSPFAKMALELQGKLGDGEDKPKPEDTTKKETDELDSIKLEEGTSVKAKEAFAKVNSDRVRLKKELQALAAEKEELAAKVAKADSDENTKRAVALEAEVARLKEAMEEKENRLYALDVKRSEKWKQVIDTPLQDLAVQVESIAKKYEGIDIRELRKAMAGDDTNLLSDLLSDVNEFDKAELAKVRSEVKGILSLRKNLESDAKRAMEILDNAQQKQIESDRNAKLGVYKNTVEATVGYLEKSIPLAFTPIEGDEEHAKMVENYRTFLATADPTQFTAEATGQTAALAAAAPLMGLTIDRLNKELAVAYDKIKKLSKASAPAGSSGTKQTETPTSSSGSLSDFVREQLRVHGR